MVQALEIDDQDVPNGWLVQDLRKSFISLLKDYIWRSITRLTEMVAEGLIEEKQSNATCSSSPLASDNEPRAKRPKTLTTISSILSRPRLDQPIAQCEMTPESMAKAEIQIFKALDLKTEVEPQQACKWWGMKSQRELLPCLSEVALALLANKTSAGGLECDFGGMNDVIALKRSSLRAGLIEVNMFLKMNKHLLCSDVSEVVKLDLQWKSFIPKRPAMSEYDTNDEDKNDIEADEEYEA